MMEKLSITVEVPVPRKLLVKVNKEFEKGALNNAIKVITSMIHSHIKNGAPMAHHLPYATPLKEKIIPAKKYSTVWTKLESLKIIEVKKLSGNTTFSIKKGICKRYRISPLWLDDDVEYIPHTIYVEDLKVEKTPICLKIKDILLRLKIDKDSLLGENPMEARCLAKLKNNLKVENSTLRYKYRKKWYKKAFSKYNLENYLKFERINISQRLKSSLNYIENNLFYISKSHINGRIHYNLTSLPSELFESLRIDGEKVKELDLKNSQPLLLAYLINESINKRKPILGDSFLINKLNKIIPLLFPSLLTDKGATNSDILVFIEKTQQGQLYEYFADQLSAELPDQTAEERRQYAKGCFIKTLYSNNKYTSDKKKAFYRVFPDLSKLMENLKNDLIQLFIEHERSGVYPELERYTQSRNKSKKTPFVAGNDYLPINLQELESKIFIETCLPKLYENELTVLPKHDSILCKSSEYQSVKEVMTIQLDQIFGVGGYCLKPKQTDGEFKIQSIDSYTQVEAA